MGTRARRKKSPERPEIDSMPGLLEIVAWHPSDMDAAVLAVQEAIDAGSVTQFLAEPDFGPQTDLRRGWRVSHCPLTHLVVAGDSGATFAFKWEGVNEIGFVGLAHDDRMTVAVYDFAGLMPLFRPGVSGRDKRWIYEACRRLGI